MKQQPNKIIAKMAHILMLIETRIQNDGAAYLPKQRSRFIDITTHGLSDQEDDFFTYDQLKLMVINMVQRHETGARKWQIDTQNSTDDQIAVAIEGGPYTLIPVSLFMAATTSNPGPLH